MQDAAGFGEAAAVPELVQSALGLACLLLMPQQLVLQLAKLLHAPSEPWRSALPAAPAALTCLPAGSCSCCAS
jgi:hypothetical protein